MLVPWLAPEISFLLNLICFLIFQGRYFTWSFVFWAFFGQVLLASSRWRLGKLLNILHRTVPTTKNYPVQNVSSATVENPCSKITNFRLDHSSKTAAHQASPLDEIREPVVLPRATLASWNQQESLPVFPLFSALLCQGRSFPLPSVS